LFDCFFLSEEDACKRFLLLSIISMKFPIVPCPPPPLFSAALRWRTRGPSPSRWGSWSSRRRTSGSGGASAPRGWPRPRSVCGPMAPVFVGQTGGQTTPPPPSQGWVRTSLCACSIRPRYVGPCHRPYVGETGCRICPPPPSRLPPRRMKDGNSQNVVWLKALTYLIISVS